MPTALQNLRRSLAGLGLAASIALLFPAAALLADDEAGKADPAAKPAAARPKAKAKADGAVAAKVKARIEARARARRAVAKKEEAITAEALFDRLGRPERVVEPPTINAAEIDRMLEAHLKEAEVTPARLVSDEEFVRRACVDVTGKQPEPSQVVAFVKDRDPKKRAKLIDKLLDSPDYAANWARYWRDVISYRATNEQRNLIRYDTLEDWLEEQFAANRPWDEIATAMIAAEGDNTENGAIGLFAAHRAVTVEVAGEVSRIFMGVQIQCAQCHDHPTDPWKREQFHEFAAFFEGTRARPNARKNADGKVVRNGLTLVNLPRARYTMPDLEDPQKNIPVEPKFFLASSEAELPKNLAPAVRREVAASYITGQDNPWFARAYVNRVWAALVGEGFYVPIDDMGPAREANAPEVIDRLASEWARGGYDVKWLYRTILNTRAYQRQYRSTRSESGLTPFAANCPSRLSADQIVDALIRVLDLPLDGAAGRRQMRQAGQGAQAARRGPGGPRALMNLLFGVDPSTPTDEVISTIPQSLFLMNSPIVNNRIAARPNTPLGQILIDNPDNARALEALYLHTLARRPTPEEVETCGRYLRTVGNRREGFEDIFWALINSTEFISRR